MKDTRRCERVIVTFSTELTATKLHLPCEPWLGWGYLLSSNSYISWKGWSRLRLCIVFYRDNLYLKEQNSKVDLKANRFKTSVTSLVGLTEALEEEDFPCCWTSEHLGLKVELGKMLEQVTAPPQVRSSFSTLHQANDSINICRLVACCATPILPFASQVLENLNLRLVISACGFILLGWNSSLKVLSTSPPCVHGSERSCLINRAFISTLTLCVLASNYRRDGNKTVLTSCRLYWEIRYFKFSSTCAGVVKVHEITGQGDDKVPRRSGKSFLRK